MRTCVALITLSLLAGCGTDRPQISGLMVADHGFVSSEGTGPERGDRNTTIVGWNANNNVALFDGHGQGCFEAAAAFKTQDRETALSAALPKLLGAGGDINAVNRVLESVKLLSDKDNAVTFLDTALSNICILAMNQTNHKVQGAVLTRQDLVDLIKYSIDAASKIESKHVEAQVASHDISIGKVTPNGQPVDPKPIPPTQSTDASVKVAPGK